MDDARGRSNLDRKARETAVQIYGEDGQIDKYSIAAAIVRSRYVGNISYIYVLGLLVVGVPSSPFFSFLYVTAVLPAAEKKRKNCLGLVREPVFWVVTT